MLEQNSFNALYSSSSHLSLIRNSSKINIVRSSIIFLQFSKAHRVEEYKSASDWDFWLRCAFAGSEYKKLSEPLGLYYFNPEGMSTNPENKKWKRKEEFGIFKKYQKQYLEEQK